MRKTGTQRKLKSHVLGPRLPTGTVFYFWGGNVSTQVSEHGSVMIQTRCPTLSTTDFGHRNGSEPGYRKA